MAFGLDKKNTGFKTLEEGEYEVYPIEFAKEVTKNGKNAGTKMAQFNYIVRDDVDQEGKGQKIRFDNFMEMENTLWRVNQASEAAGLDMEAEYEDIYEWAEDFKNKAVRVVVGQRTYNGKTFPEVKSFKESHYGGEYKGDMEPKKGGVQEASTTEPTEPVEIDDEDLPF